MSSLLKNWIIRGIYISVYLYAENSAGRLWGEVRTHLKRFKARAHKSGDSSQSDKNGRIPTMSNPFKPCISQRQNNG
eukprot:1331088-Amorphochlora_amoeboformis.AAC.1